MATVNGRGEIVAVNDAWTRQFALPNPDQLWVGTLYPDAWMAQMGPGLTGEALKAGLDSVLSGGAATFTMDQEVADGGCWFALIAADNSAPEPGALILHLPTDAMAGSEPEGSERVAAMQAAQEKAEKSDAVKSEFLANMSHEIRTPLNAILGFAEIMERELYGPLGDDRYREYASDIRGAASFLLGIVNDMLDLSKIEAGRYALHEDHVDLRKAIEAAARLIEPGAGDRNLAVKVEVADGLSAIWADDRAVRQILLNLLSNAVKFTPDEGRINVSAEREADGGLMLSVQDTGIGIAKEDIATALTPFVQVDNEMSRQHPGTGLGLPLSKSLVELHGGSMEIDSELGVGTTVTLHIPAKRVAA